jgi:hypothetical protein
MNFKVVAIVAGVFLFLGVLAMPARDGNLDDVAAAMSSGAPRTSMHSEISLGKRFLYGALTPVIDATSVTHLLGSRWLAATRPAQGDVLHHEGAHRLTDVRYKEWWYFDAHDDSGLVMSCSIVFSIVKDHYFLWIYDPKSNKVLVELEEDTKFTANDFGTEGVELASARLKISGRSDRGYSIWFDGRTTRGEFVFAEPMEGRTEVHEGPWKTQYALYQVPRMKLGGTLENKQRGETSKLSGVAYHDHWWGIDDRTTRWEWMQAKFENGWASSFYEGRYGKEGDDLHRYAWLHTPETGYVYFDNSTFDFHTDKEGERWTASITGNEGTLTLHAAKRLERYEWKPVLLEGVPLGEVRYHQFPIEVVGTYVDPRGKSTELRSQQGMLEWDWYAIW